MFMVIFINYMDRVNFSVSIPAIRQEFGRILRCCLPFCFVDVFHFLIPSGVEVSGKPGALHEREHERSSAAVLSKGHRPVSVERSRDPGRCKCTEFQTPENAWLEDTCRSSGRLSKICSTIECCDDRLNPPVHERRRWRPAASVVVLCPPFTVRLTHLHGIEIN